jgi:transposase-like protein
MTNFDDTAKMSKQMVIAFIEKMKARKRNEVGKIMEKTVTCWFCKNEFIFKYGLDLDRTDIFHFRCPKCMKSLVVAGRSEDLHSFLP